MSQETYNLCSFVLGVINTVFVAITCITAIIALA